MRASAQNAMNEIDEGVIVGRHCDTPMYGSTQYIFTIKGHKDRKEELVRYSIAGPKDTYFKYKEGDHYPKDKKMGKNERSL